MTLRWYQSEALDNLDNGWVAGHKCQVLRMGTGTGKSKTGAHAVKDFAGASLMMAHRGEIVAQLALALAREGVRHRVIGPDSLSRLVRAYQIDEMGRHFVDSSAKCAVASVQTMASLKGENHYLRQIGFVVADEFHHFTRNGQFGKVLEMFSPEARILGPTACTQRTDGKGLARHADGYADFMVLGPDESVMKEQGFLCPYRIFVPPTTFDRAALHLNAAGEFKADEVKAQAKGSSIFGDAVEHYVANTPGKLALQFCDSLDNAILATQKMKAAGVASEVLSGKTDPGLRRNILKRFAKREITHISSVSLIDEGFDCPAVEVVLDTAATTSLNRFRQRFGRCWRPAPGKTAYYFDFVGNVRQHGLPDSPRVWSLERRERRNSSGPDDTVPVRVCIKCTSAYPAIKSKCPHCQTVHVPQSRSGPAQVDGVLAELDPAYVAQQLGVVAEADAPPKPYGDAKIDGRNRSLHWDRQQAQKKLRSLIALYGGWKMGAEGMEEAESDRTFFFRYRIDRMNAWALGTKETEKLAAWIEADLQAANIVEQTA